MPTYSFIIHHRGEKTEPVDVELPDKRAEWSQAVVACGEAMEELDGDFGENDEWLMTVSDEAGHLLFELRCTSRHFAQR